jgi:selenoprotein W-related protein
LAAELEEKLQEDSTLIQSSGGVFEVQDRDFLIFSKKELGRFPEDGEILEIVRYMSEGMGLEESQAKAGANAHKPMPFMEWFKGFLDRGSSTARR